VKIAILSDIHDNIWKLDKVLNKLKGKNIKAIIFCGDFCAPFTFRKLAESGIPIYAVFGNVDGAQQEITEQADKKYKNVKLGKYLIEIELDGKKIAFCHNDKFAESLVSTEKYDAVFHGHTHEARVKKIGKTLLANPGEIHGFKGECSFGIYDTETNEIKIIKIGD